MQLSVQNWLLSTFMPCERTHGNVKDQLNYSSRTTEPRDINTQYNRANQQQTAEDWRKSDNIEEQLDQREEQRHGPAVLQVLL